jgi:hypothetical protein
MISSAVDMWANANGSQKDNSEFENIMKFIDMNDWNISISVHNLLDHQYKALRRKIIGRDSTGYSLYIYSDYRDMLDGLRNNDSLIKLSVPIGNKKGKSINISQYLMSLSIIGREYQSTRLSFGIQLMFHVPNINMLTSLSLANLYLASQDVWQISKMTHLQLRSLELNNTNCDTDFVEPLTIILLTMPLTHLNITIHQLTITDLSNILKAGKCLESFCCSDERHPILNGDIKYNDFIDFSNCHNLTSFKINGFCNARRIVCSPSLTNVSIEFAHRPVGIEMDKIIGYFDESNVTSIDIRGHGGIDPVFTHVNTTLTNLQIHTSVLPLESYIDPILSTLPNLEFLNVSEYSGTNTNIAAVERIIQSKYPRTLAVYISVPNPRKYVCMHEYKNKRITLLSLCSSRIYG